MIKPKRLQRGDTVAVVSLSWGGLGDEGYLHLFHIAKKRLEEEFGLRVIAMPHALKGSDFVAKHPEKRAQDFMDAFKDPRVSAVFSAIGGDDTIRILPYVDFDVLRNHPKIFMGYSDTTVNHFMMYKAGVISYYGPSVMVEFGEYVKMAEYTKNAVEDLLFGGDETYQMLPSSVWSDDHIPWKEENMEIPIMYKHDPKGYEVISGRGKVQGHLLGGCLDVFMMIIGTSIWPGPEEWKDAILFMETSEEKPSPDFVRLTLRNLAAQGILGALKGIIVGKPKDETYYEEYKEAILQVVKIEERLHDLPVFYNVNFGHARPIGILPYGIQVELDCDRKSLTFLESATEERLG
ncbi:S66 family peptidase [Proteiniclasticum ruminis]|uniref:Muramoyltetrapeptide carboxypeptidase LdcA (Peptidoglycan recycling) n=1 Tax=Proteiniclasticum ruminis TaxID=398199 RepID=A0A1I5DU55_9CLOT|nr:S66 peptidase family protein [Proteiniclasticum ruminis]SFO02792.1 Muramoyltetrapeptide carboxypeptidase LdcA (peptidoglycan recycling) [Proteiniclasticum ruminis]